jgi:hypothetical protein
MWKPWIARGGSKARASSQKGSVAGANLQQKDATGASRDLAPIIRSSTL